MWIRQIHRWLSIMLVLMIVSYALLMKVSSVPGWFVYAPLVPFFLLLATGLYLFVQPYAAKWHRAASSTTVAQSLS